METKHKSIELVGFREELLPSGRKLLHCDFKDKFGAAHYRWVPPWKGESGVERLFFKALEIEEWNDYDGVWSKELRKAADEIPTLEEIKLPVTIRVGAIKQLAAPLAENHEEEAYRVGIDLLSDEVEVWEQVEDWKSFICIGEVRISWDSLKNSLLKGAPIEGVAKHIQREATGVRFWVILAADRDKAEYQFAGRRIASHIRSFIRKCISDYHAFKRGFEES
jgi:hypothetical protein